MSSPPTLAPIVTGYACITALNTNFDLIEDYLTELLNMVEGGTMQADIDMDSNRIHNLPDPVDPGEPVTKSYLEAVLAAL